MSSARNSTPNEALPRLVALGRAMLCPESRPYLGRHERSTSLPRIHRIAPSRRVVIMSRVPETGRVRAVRATTIARLLQLALAVLALGLIVSVPTPLVSAATPGPDPAPVKPSPPPPPPPASQPLPAPTYTPATTTTRSSTTKATTNSHKRKGHKRVTAEFKPKLPAKVTPKPIPLGTASKELPSTNSDSIRLATISLVGVGMLLLALAALEPRYVRPRRLITTYANHRGDVAAAGAVILFSVGIAYLSSTV